MKKKEERKQKRSLGKKIVKTETNRREMQDWTHLYSEEKQGT